MSGSNGQNLREFSEDGITVQQTFSEDDFGVPAVRIRLESERDNPLDVTLGVALPESESVDRVGFHPDYDPDNWSIDGNSLSYHTRLSPQSDVTTVYAVQDLASDNGSVLLENLAIHGISAVDEGETENGVDNQTESDESGVGGESEDGGASGGATDTDGQSDRPDPTDSEDVEHGRPEPVTVLVSLDGEVAAVPEQGRALLDPGLDVVADRLLVFGGDHRAHVDALVEAVADGHLVGQLDDPVGELVVDRLLDEYDVLCETALAGTRTRGG